MANCYKILRIILFVLSVIGLVLYITAFAIPKWANHKDGSEGLWQVCFTNDGQDTCSTWPDHLLTADLKIVQILACFGLAFYAFFVFAAALTIFWTNQWKKAKAIKYSTAAFAFLTVAFLAVCLVLYKGDKESSTTSLTISWYLTIIGAVIAGILAPFYLIDACRTVAPKKPDREKLFGRIDNIPPMPAPTSYPSKQLDGDAFGGKPEGKNNRPPLLSTLRKQHTTFIHPPPKPSTKKLTTKEIKAFPLPPTNTKLNLFEVEEIEDHPSPIPAPDSQRRGKYDSDSTSISLASTSVEDLPGEVEKPNGIFKFHKTKTIQKGGKTMLKIQNDKQKLPPVMMVMPGIDESDNDSTDEAPTRRAPNNSLMDQWEQEQARRKFAPYFVDAMKMPLREKSELSPSERLQQKFKKKMDSLGNSEPSEAAKKRINEASTIYDEKSNKNNNDEKTKTQKKSKKNKKLSDTTPDVQSQTGITIYNDISEEEA